MILSSRASRATTTAFSSPYTQNNISYFGGMYRKNKGVPGLELATYRHAHQKQACTLLYTCVACFFFSFLVGCCPLPYIKTNSSSWVYQKQHISSKRVYCYINKHTNRGHNLHGRVVGRKKIKKGQLGMGSSNFWAVRTSCVLRHPVLYC